MKLYAALHPSLGLVWHDESKICVSPLKKNEAKAESGFTTILKKKVVICQWIIGSKNLLVDVDEDNVVSLWRYFESAKQPFNQVFTLKVQHKVNELYQISRLNVFLLLGRIQSTAVYFSDVDQMKDLSAPVTCTFSGSLTYCCCWLPTSQCLLLSTSDDNFQCQDFSASQLGLQVQMSKKIQLLSSPGRLRVLTSVGSFVFCAYDAPMEENIKGDINQVHSSNDEGHDHLHSMLNHTSKLIKSPCLFASSSSASSLRVFDLNLVDDSSATCAIPEVASLPVKSLMLPDLIAAHEVSPSEVFIFVGSSKCSSLYVFVFDSLRRELILKETMDFQGQKVRGVSILKGHLVCFTSEVCNEDSFLFLSRRFNEETNTKLLVSEHPIGRLQSKEQTANSERQQDHISFMSDGHCDNSDCRNGNDGNDDDDDDGIEINENNFVLPGILLPQAKKCLIEEVAPRDGCSGTDTENVAAADGRATITDTFFTCSHCGQTNSISRCDSSNKHDDLEGFSTHLDSVVASTVQRELKKFRLELLEEIKSILLSK